MQIFEYPYPTLDISSFGLSSIYASICENNWNENKKMLNLYRLKRYQRQIVKGSAKGVRYSNQGVKLV